MGEIRTRSSISKTKNMGPIQSTRLDKPVGLPGGVAPGG